jgi:hypothetical protein
MREPATIHAEARSMEWASEPALTFPRNSTRRQVPESG